MMSAGGDLTPMRALQAALTLLGWILTCFIVYGGWAPWSPGRSSDNVSKRTTLTAFEVRRQSTFSRLPRHLLARLFRTL